MALTKEKKVSIVDDLRKALADSSAVTFVEFTKLTVHDATALRTQLRNAGVGYMVAKKTLIKRALAEKGFSGELPDLTGQVGMAFGNDPLVPSREVYNFQLSHPTNISIIGGVFDGAYVSKDSMMAIATIPPIPVLRGQFVGVLMSPIRSFVVALDQIAKSKTA